ncbi:MAG: Crp/Fnr family transcriptional regulator [Acidimicrobiaceae bacterium]|nr:Crp/Fnr family transcriptional regulator [Acidimicrobiaceae bacterium]
MNSEKTTPQTGYVDAKTLLLRTAFFKALDAVAIDEVTRSHKRSTYLRGRDVFVEGDPSSELFVVATGRVAIVKSAIGGKDSLMALMEPGDLFGEMGLFDDQGRSATARCLERTELLKVPYSALRLILHQRPGLLWGMLELLAKRLRNTDGALADAMFLDVPGRTAKRILEISGGELDFILPLTQEELAGLVGASRERVNKAIAALCKAGVLEVIDRRYRILDPAELLRLTGESK